MSSWKGNKNSIEYLHWLWQNLQGDPDTKIKSMFVAMDQIIKNLTNKKFDRCDSIYTGYGLQAVRCRRKRLHKGKHHWSSGNDSHDNQSWE